MPLFEKKTPEQKQAQARAKAERKAEEAQRLRKSYYYQYGTTLAGLMRLHDVCPNAFLDYVHDIDLSVIAPAPGLRDALDAGRVGHRRTAVLLHDNAHGYRASRSVVELRDHRVFRGGARHARHCADGP